MPATAPSQLTLLHPRLLFLEGTGVCTCSAPAWNTLPHLPQVCVHLPKHHCGSKPLLEGPIYNCKLSSPAFPVSLSWLQFLHLTWLFHMFATLSKMSPLRTGTVSALVFAASPESSQGLAQDRHSTSVCRMHGEGQGLSVGALRWQNVRCRQLQGCPGRWVLTH